MMAVQLLDNRLLTLIVSCLGVGRYCARFPRLCAKVLMVAEPNRAAISQIDTVLSVDIVHQRVCGFGHCMRLALLNRKGRNLS